jgi:hypothetical protein
MENNNADLEKIRDDIRDLKVRINELKVNLCNVVLDVTEINEVMGYNFDATNKDIKMMRIYTGIGYFTLGFALAVMLRIR